MGLAEMPAFRMRLEVEPPDDVGGGETWHALIRLILRSASRARLEGWAVPWFGTALQRMNADGDHLC
jgi:hypothetical protein